MSFPSTPEVRRAFIRTLVREKKHEPTGPTPPADALRSYIELTRSKPLDADTVSQWLANGCLGFGFGSGFGSGGNTSAPSAQTQKPRPVCASKTSKSDTESFDEFYQAYPRKKARKDALAAWMKIPAVDRPAIIAAIPRLRCSEEWQREGGRYVPHPATFLRGERWKDELCEVQTVAARPTNELSAEGAQRIKEYGVVGVGAHE